MFMAAITRGRDPNPEKHAAAVGVPAAMIGDFIGRVPA